MPEETEVLLIIAQLMMSHPEWKHPFTNVSFDADHKSGELIFEFHGQEFVIRSCDVHKYVPENVAG